MKAELLKREDHYGLYNEDGHKIADTIDGCNSKISKENCDEIFGVVDVVDVIYKQAKNGFDGIIDPFTEAFAKACIDKSMELNKDKLFTVEDLYRAFLINSAGNNTTLRNFFEQTVLPMFEQPTEIEVEVEMEKVVDETKMIGVVKGVKGSGNKITTYKSVPKLDSDGCLILKRI